MSNPQQPTETDADYARRRGWVPGTLLAGDEGYGVTVIKITAIGEQKVMAYAVSHKGKATDGATYEGMWTFAYRDWQQVNDAQEA